MSDPAANTTSIQVMARMFSLLDTLAHEGTAVSLRVISERTGLHPSTAHRILNDLAVGGFVERSGPGAYRLGLKLLQLGNLVRARLDLKELATKPMQELHRITGYVVGLYVQQEQDAVCVTRSAQERGHVHISRVTGGRSPLTSGVPGRVIISQWATPEIQALAQQQGCSADTLHAQIQIIRTEGLGAEDDGNGTTRLIAAPVFDDSDRIIAALTLSGPPGPVSVELCSALKNTAQRLSGLLGWLGNRS